MFLSHQIPTFLPFYPLTSFGTSYYHTCISPQQTCFSNPISPSSSFPENNHYQMTLLLCTLFKYPALSHCYGHFSGTAAQHQLISPKILYPRRLHLLSFLYSSFLFPTCNITRIYSNLHNKPSSVNNSNHITINHTVHSLVILHKVLRSFPSPHAHNLSEQYFSN